MLDSGATRHFCGSRELFSSFRKLFRPVTVDLAAGSTTATHAGDIYLQITQHRILRLRGVLFIPSGANLISLTKLAADGIDASISMRALTSSDSTTGRPFCSIKPSRGLFSVAPKVVRPKRYHCAAQFVRSTPVVQAFNVSISKLWHFRLGHMSVESAREMRKIGLLPPGLSSRKQYCVGCIQGKLHRAPIPQIAEHRRGLATRV